MKDEEINILKDACFSYLREVVEKDVEIDEKRSVLADLCDARNVDQKRISFLDKEVSKQRIELRLAEKKEERNTRVIASLTEKVEDLKLQLKALQKPLVIDLHAEEIDSFSAFLDEQMPTEKEEEDPTTVRIRERSPPKTPELEMEEILERKRTKREAREVPFTLRTYQSNLDRDFERNLQRQHENMKQLHQVAKRGGKHGVNARKMLRFFHE